MYEVKPLKRFKFPKSEHISIFFERHLPGGWQLALETSDKVICEFLMMTTMLMNGTVYMKNYLYNIFKAYFI